MKGLETGKDRVQKICDVLKKETLEPAKQQAKEIVENANMQAEEIVKAAEEKVRELHTKAKEEIEQKKKIFDSSLNLAANQFVEELRQRVMEKLFNENLASVVAKATSESKIITKLLEAIVLAIEEEGVDTDISAYIPKKIAAREINEVLGKNVLNRLREGRVVLGDFEGGLQVKLHNQQITLDISDVAIREIVAEYVHRDFREMIFSSQL